ncbi:murein DD-endopeptidase MepM/ murein hydrolase activator NlpD [Nocardioides thalensis]|uniref:Murein DD-endopeptidase MepM/ murein hydrolase activator NlpD n=1 Tax=Nocardioides thalensis TaxID=1914755 RepID=A0A853C258_9ACTN|nr:murein DD-endopeptidase MepM/ murein hydrolase activator NlpD [Nocardioides thalensis]
MGRSGSAAVVATALVALSACGTGDDESPAPGARSPDSSSAAPSARPTTSSPTTATTPTTGPTETATRTRSPRPPRRSPEPDPRWAFYTDDRTPQRSPWYAGAHPVMIPFGCTPAPYYDPDPACTDGQGFHHGIDVAMPCGTPLLAARPAQVLDNASLGSAYGSNPVLLRVDGQDVVIGHTTEVYVEPGETVARGERFALAGDSGAPDGCHLHFEVRPAGGSYLDAVDPASLLSLHVRGGP